MPAYYIIACAQASSNLARYDGVRFGRRAQNSDDLTKMYIKSRSEGFGREVRRRIMLGNFVLSAGYYDAYYNKALRARRVIRDTLSDAFKNMISSRAPFIRQLRRSSARALTTH